MFLVVVSMYLSKKLFLLYTTKFLKKRKLKHLSQYNEKSFVFMHKTWRGNHGITFGLLLAITFIISLEESLLPTIKKHVAHWKQYVDDTPAIINPSKIKYTLQELNYVRNYITLYPVHRWNWRKTDTYISWCTYYCYRKWKARDNST